MIQSVVGFLPQTKIGTSGIDNFHKCSHKITNSYLKVLTNVDTRKINKKNRNNIFIDAELNMIGNNIRKKLFRNNSNK